MSKKFNVIVYNLEDPDQKSFFVGVNGNRINGPTGVEMEMEESMVEVMENAIVDTTIRDPETNKEIPYQKQRFKVIRLNEVLTVTQAAPVAPVAPETPEEKK